MPYCSRPERWVPEYSHRLLFAIAGPGAAGFILEDDRAEILAVAAASYSLHMAGEQSDS
jgi:hypothetical protein